MIYAWRPRTGLCRSLTRYSIYIFPSSCFLKMQCSWGHLYQLDHLSRDPLWLIGHSDPRINFSTRSFDRKYSFYETVQFSSRLYWPMHLEKTPTCILPCLSEVSATLLSNQFPCSSDWWWCDTLKVRCLKEAHSPLWWCGWPDCWVILVWPLVTLSHKISPKSHFGHLETCIIFLNCSPWRLF